MKIGFLLPANYAVSGPGNGVRVQAAMQAAALEQAGHSVVRMNPWDIYDSPDFDVIQFFQGGFAHYGMGTSTNRKCRLMVFSPIIDSNESNYGYKLAASLGHLNNKMFTIPGVFYDQASDSDLIICRSKHESDRLTKGLGVSPSKVEIVLNGTNPPVRTDPEVICKKFGLPREFILHVSAYTQARKNTLRMAEAIGPTGLPLVIAGTKTDGPVLDALNNYAKRFKNIRLLGFLDKTTLSGLYAGCKVFCLPSLHEGTGLVALDAGSFGSNVVITKNGGTLDYFGDMVEYVDPFDVDNIRGAVMNAWETKRSNRLREHILQNLTWEKSAAGLISAYSRHLNKKYLSN